MFALFAVHKIKPEHCNAFQKAIFEDAIGSIKNEPGCLCFEVLQDEKDQNTFCLYEMYTDRAAFEKHMTLPHVLKWQNTVKDFYSEKPTVQFCQTTFPSNDILKKIQTIMKENVK